MAGTGEFEIKLGVASEQSLDSPAFKVQFSIAFGNRPAQFALTTLERSYRARILATQAFQLLVARSYLSSAAL
jgi:hypothetical protein